jgi:protein SCO1/2
VVITSVVNALALTFLLGLESVQAEDTALAALAETPSATQIHHDHQEGDGAHHHHHEVAPGYQRSLATYAVPAVTLVNQDSERRLLPDLVNSDRPVMLNFIFTSCTAICPAMTAIFAKVQSELGSDSERVRMVSISIDPEHDTPAVLAEYAGRFGAGPQWEFLTGSLDDSIAVQRAFDADRGDKMNHAPLTLFRANPDAEWVRYEGFATAAQLVEEYRSALAD